MLLKSNLHSALWIEAKPYQVDMESKAKTISVPKVHIEDFQSNPNRVTILQILDRQKPSENEEKVKKLPRIKLKEKLSKEYIR